MLLVLLAAGALQAAEPPAGLRIERPGCERRVVHAASPPASMPRKLEDLPPGLLQLAVDKRVGGCSVTVLPTRDAQGNHRMIRRGETPHLRRADGSRPEGRSKRQR